jgi:hypothetical protein
MNLSIIILNGLVVTLYAPAMFRAGAGPRGRFQRHVLRNAAGNLPSAHCLRWGE